MLRPNPTVAAMDAYALPDLSTAEGIEPIVLAQNEHFYPPSAKVRRAVEAALGNGHLYPDSDWNELRAAIADVHSLKADNILCGSGSMELMSALMQAYLSPGDHMVMTEYGYLFMRHSRQTGRRDCRYRRRAELSR